MPIQRHRQLQPRPALLLEPQESGCIHYWVGAATERHIIAAKFALLTEMAAKPPDGRMEEEQRLHRRLNHVPQIIPATDVGEFMCQHNLKLIGVEMSQR